MNGCESRCCMAFALALGCCASVCMSDRCCAMEDDLSPPVAKVEPVETTLHGEKRVDKYAWLRNRDEQRTIDYLEAENAYTKRMMAHTQELQTELYDEMLGRIQETDLSAPYRKGGYRYYTRTEEGKPYAVYCRDRGVNSTEEVILDGNALAAGTKYFRIGVFNTSPGDDLLAYSVDTTGSERYTLRFKNMRTGELLPEVIEGTYYSSAWSSDDRFFFYVTVDNATRPYRLWRHELNTDPANDVLVYEESDERFFLDVLRTRDGEFLVMHLESTETTEDHILEADKPLENWRIFEPRKQGVEYHIDHMGTYFFGITNADKAVNFKLITVADDRTTSDRWFTMLYDRPELYLTGIDCFDGFFVLSARENGVPVLKFVATPHGKGLKTIEQPEPVYNVSLTNNEMFMPVVRFSYSSPITPPTIIDYFFKDGNRRVIKETPVPNYDPSKYVVKRLDAPARDGEKVPIALVMRRDLDLSQPHPMLLRGYGSYGFSYPDTFRSNDVSLLDRGFIVGVAHIRGGSEKGRRWYEDGRLKNKKHTFTDFIDSAKFLIDEGLTTPDRLAIQGGSAGGLLMGAVTNMAPELFNVVVANVPFVDVINTMLDETIPLTVIEWEQWGNPHTEADYRYMRSYSPYDNVETKAYPNMLVTAGLNDPRVGYWEPAKWVAKLRATKTDSHTLLLKTNMGAGHGGASGRYSRLKERALEYAFILDHINN